MSILREFGSETMTEEIKWVDSTYKTFGVNSSDKNARNWLGLLGATDLPRNWQAYFSIYPDGRAEASIYYRNKDDLKIRRDYAGVSGFFQQGKERPATEACDEIDWDRFRDEVWVSSND